MYMHIHILSDCIILFIPNNTNYYKTYFVLMPALSVQDQRAYSFCGTIEYMAPEVIKGGNKGHDFVSLSVA